MRFHHPELAWQAVTDRVIIQLIASTTTQTGLTVQCPLDETAFEKAPISDAQIASINLTLAEFHGEWSYLIASRP